MQPDVEALLVNRVGAARDISRVPIDECYKLVGIDPNSLARPFRRLRWSGAKSPVLREPAAIGQSMPDVR